MEDDVGYTWYYNKIQPKKYIYTYIIQSAVQ